MTAAPHRNGLKFIALALPALVSLPLIAGFFGSFHPAFDSFAHFRVHLAALLAMSAVPAAFFRLRKEALATFAFAIAALSTTSSALPVLNQALASFSPKDEAQAVYRLLQFNARFDNREPAKLFSLIGTHQPDIITLDEVSVMWAAELERISAAYPHRLICAAPKRVGGVAILSRRPFAEGQPGHCLDGGSAAAATIDLGGRSIDVAALHLAWPWPFGQARQVDGLAGEFAGLGNGKSGAVIAGDFNATPWSAAVRRLQAAGAFTQVPAVGPTWLPRQLPKSLRGWIGLPIDHVLTNGGVMVHSARTVEDAGSDHAPVLIEFSLFRTDTVPPEDATQSMTVSTGAAAFPES